MMSLTDFSSMSVDGLAPVAVAVLLMFAFDEDWWSNDWCRSLSILCLIVNYLIKFYILVL